MVLLDEIDADEGFNSRGVIDETGDDIAALSMSVRSAGLLSALAVRPRNAVGKYPLVAGFRRYFALRRIGAKRTFVVITEFQNDAEALIANLVENLHRSRLRTYDVMRSLIKLRDEFGMSQQAIAQRLRKSPAFVSKLCGLERLIPELLDMLRRNDSEATIETLLAASRLEPEEQMEVFWEIKGLGAVAKADESRGQQRPVRHRMRNRVVIKGALEAVDAAEGFEIADGEVVELGYEARRAVERTLRWVLGESKRCPFLRATESEEETDDEDQESA